MAKTKAPLLGFQASGQIGKTIVFGTWKGQGYARQHVIPSNPQTSEQNLTRNAFSFLQASYKIAPSLFTDAWELYAKGIAMTARNAYTKFNLGFIRGETDLDNWVASPGAKGGLPAASATPTPGSGTLSVAVAAPSVLPVGWTIYSAIVSIIRDQDPSTGVLYTVKSGEDLTSTYAVAFSGLAAGVWQYRAYLKWNRPDGTFAYSPDIGGQSTVT